MRLIAVHCKLPLFALVMTTTRSDWISHISLTSTNQFYSTSSSSCASEGRPVMSSLLPRGTKVPGISGRRAKCHAKNREGVDYDQQDEAAFPCSFTRSSIVQCF